MALLIVLIGCATLLGPSAPAGASPEIVSSSVRSSAGELFTATNHLVDLPGIAPPGAAGHRPKEYLVVWAGDANAADTTGADVQNAPLQVSPGQLAADARDALPGPDFLAVIDADKGSPHYGKVVNTVTLGPLVENEPHHMQYIHHAGDKIFAGGLYSDTTYVLDTTKLPLLELSGVNTPTDTPCGSVPDAYWVLRDGTAYGTYMGGPDLPGPCSYSDGSVRSGNGFAGTPGEVVRIGEDGRTLAEAPAALPTAEDPAECVSLPALGPPSCANPHGIQVREDLDRMVTSDYAEPRNILFDPVRPPTHNILRRTVRLWDISDRNRPELVSVSRLPDGPRVERNPAHEENMGIMETTVTNLPRHRGAFAESMCGGAVFYTPDITAAEPQWREVFDDTTAAKRVDPNVTEGAGCDGGGWVQTSLDDRYLYHAVIGRGPGSQSAVDQGSPKMVYVLDIQALLAAGNDPQCSIDTIDEVSGGGAEPDCPTLVDVLPVTDATTGGPHWGALDNYARGEDGFYRETNDVRRISIANYFVARSGIDGNHKVCMVDVSRDGDMELDRTFLDENRGGTCVDFNRTSWPHGDWGDAKPHSQLFVVADDDAR
ncbi:MAG: hypothetical protein ACRDT0_14605 [Pseudonocardiaceae bacterium]